MSTQNDSVPYAKLRASKRKIIVIVVSRVITAIAIGAFIVRIVMDYPHIPSAVYCFTWMAIVIAGSIFGEINLSVRGSKGPFKGDELKRAIDEYRYWRTGDWKPSKGWQKRNVSERTEQLQQRTGSGNPGHSCYTASFESLEPGYESVYVPLLTITINHNEHEELVLARFIDGTTNQQTLDEACADVKKFILKTHEKGIPIDYARFEGERISTTENKALDTLKMSLDSIGASGNRR